jgi:hypothetical protein
VFIEHRLGYRAELGHIALSWDRRDLKMETAIFGLQISV